MEQIQWRYADAGDGQPGPIQTANGNTQEVAVSDLDSDREIHIDLTATNFTGSFITRRTAAADTDPAKVVPVKTAYGNRPLPIPYRYFAEGQDELLDPNTHPMVMGYTHTAIKDGRFDDPTVWNTGTVPGAGAIWSTGNFYIRYTHESDAIMDSGLVPMRGRLTHVSNGDTRMRIGYLMTMGGHVINDPEWSVTPGKPKHEIVFHPIGAAPGPTARLGGMFMGPTRHVGAVSIEKLRMKPATGQQVASVAAGATSIAIAGLADAVAAGKIAVGAVMVISATRYIPTASTDPQYTGPTTYYSPASQIGTKVMNQFQFSESEERIITGIAGDVASFADPLIYPHAGDQRTLKDGTVVTLNPVVAFPCRSVRFRTASAQQDSGIDPNADLTVLQKRAHVMYHRCPDVYVQDVEFMSLGRSSTDPSLQVNGLPYRVEMAGGSLNVQPILTALNGTPLANPDNVTGRWAAHFHWCGGPYGSSELIVCRRAAVWAPKWAPPVPGWGFTQHGTNMAIENCVGINVRGAAFVSELGNERGHWSDNIAMDCRGDGERNEWGDRHEIYANHNGAAGVAFENQSRAILMHGNIASGCHYGYMWHAQKDKRRARGWRAVDLRLKPGIYSGMGVPTAMLREHHDEVVHIVDAQIPPMIDNEVWATRFGMAVIHRSGDGRRQSPEPMLIERFHGVDVPFFIHLPEYTNSYYFKDCSSSVSDAQKAGAQWARLANVGWDFNFFNCHVKNYGMAFSDSAVLWNYNGFVVDVTFENVTTISNQGWTTVAGTHATRDVMGPWVQNPENAGQWRIRTLESLDKSQLPQPYPLAPYGAPLPAGSPPVAFGETPYFVPSETNNLTLTAGDGRNRGSFTGAWRDSAGDRRFGDWQSPESFPSNTGVRGPVNTSKTQPEQLVERWGCWNDSGTWKCRTWFLSADRLSHVPFAFHADWTLVNFNAAFLAAHDIGAPLPAPTFPFELERSRQTPRPMTPIVQPMEMLSRTRLEAVAGQPLSHRLRPDRVSFRAEIVGGANAADFELASMGHVLRFASNGTRAAGTYAVTVRFTDVWGNSVDAPHEVVVVPSERVSPLIVDDFNRADENLDANPAYIMRGAAAGAFRITNNAVATVASTANGLLDMGSLGTSDQFLMVNFVGWNANAHVAFRAVDENNWLSMVRHDSLNVFRIQMRLNGVTSTIVDFPNVAANQVGIKVQGRKLVVMLNPRRDSNEPVPRYPRVLQNASLLTLSPLDEAGAVLLPENAPLGTHVGLITTTTATNPWLDNFHAEAI